MPDTIENNSELGLPTAELFYSRADALQPALRERAAICEANKCVSAESIADFRKAGLTKMTQPTRFGGYAMGWDVLCGVAQRLCRADGAQG